MIKFWFYEFIQDIFHHFQRIFHPVNLTFYNLLENTFFKRQIFIYIDKNIKIRYCRQVLKHINEKSHKFDYQL